MILQFVGYSLAVGALAALAAWLLESGLISVRSSGRFAYIGGICATVLAPALVLLFNDSAPRVVRIVQSPGSVQEMAGVPGAPYDVVPQMLASSIGDGSVDLIAGIIWAASSAAVIAFYLLSAWLFSRQTRRWEVASVGARHILVSPDVGPAVFGWWHPIVIFPRWLATAPEDIRQLALAHEDQHLAARDPQLLAAATLLCALFPWNPALFWMLRRLRFAMEVDCDTRVLSSGIDADKYGRALLYVCERQPRAPASALGSTMALIERASQLERRINIMFSSPRKYCAWIAGACFALSAGCIVVAAQLDAPRRMSSSILKPPPSQGIDSPGFRLGQVFEVLLQQQYPELMRQKFEGTPVVVAVVNNDWTVAQSARLDDIPAGQTVDGNEDMFAALGLTRAMVPYAGAMTMQMPQASDIQVLMVFTERQTPGVRFVSTLFPDTRAIDRDLYLQIFPAGQEISGGQTPWLLLDRSGKVLRSGIEDVAPKTWLGSFQQRYQVRTQEVTMTPITNEKGEPLRDLGGKEVQLFSIWLAPGSAEPVN